MRRWVQIDDLQGQLARVTAQNEHESVSAIDSLKESYATSTARLRAQHSAVVEDLQGRIRQLQEGAEARAAELQQAQDQASDLQVCAACLQDVFGRSLLPGTGVAAQCFSEHGLVAGIANRGEVYHVVEQR